MQGVTLVMVVSGIATVWFFVADGLLVSAISAVLFLLALFKFWKNGSDESLEGVWFHDLRDVVDRTPQRQAHGIRGTLGHAVHARACILIVEKTENSSFQSESLSGVCTQSRCRRRRRFRTRTGRSCTLGDVRRCGVPVASLPLVSDKRGSGDCTPSLSVD